MRKADLLNSSISLLGLVFMIAPLASAPKFPVTESASNRKDWIDLFDGQTLNGWKGDPVYWRVEDNSIVGEVTPETILENNSFLIYQGDAPPNFELLVEYRVSPEGNSGVQYRSEVFKQVPWALKGYQADIHGRDRWTGQNYEERGRTFLALRGQVTLLETGKPAVVIGSLGDKDELQEKVKKEDWNAYHIIVNGNVLTHILNGHVMSVVVDNDTENRRTDGRIGVQVHVGPPMKIEFRTIRLRPLD